MLRENHKYLVSRMHQSHIIGNTRATTLSSHSAAIYFFTPSEERKDTNRNKRRKIYIQREMQTEENRNIESCMIKK